jgi:hypothetical protein
LKLIFFTVAMFYDAENQKRNVEMYGKREPVVLQRAGKGFAAIGTFCLKGCGETPVTWDVP